MTSHLPSPLLQGRGRGPPSAARWEGEGSSALLFFPRHGAPADVAAAEAFRPGDLVDGFVGAGLSFAHGFADRRDSEDAAAGGDDIAVLCCGAGVEHGDAFDVIGRIEPL